MQHYSFRTEWSDEDGEYVALSPEFPGASALAATPEEAIRELKIALEGVIAVMQEDGQSAPEPATLSAFSGQFRLRLSKSQHAQLALQAEHEGVSINSLAQTYIAAGLAGEYRVRPSAATMFRLESGETVYVVPQVPNGAVVRQNQYVTAEQIEQIRPRRQPAKRRAKK